MRNKLTLIVFSLVVILSCIVQKEAFERRIDIKDFEDKTYYTEDSTHIEQFRVGGGYAKKIAKKDSLYLNVHTYYADGNIKARGKSVRYGSGAFGKWYTYDEKGNVIEIEDEDEKKGYTYKFEDVIAYAKKNNIALHKARVQRGGIGWEIDYVGLFKGSYGKYVIFLDKNTGDKEELVGIPARVETDDNNPSYLATVYDTLYYRGVRYYPEKKKENTLLHRDE